MIDIYFIIGWGTILGLFIIAFYFIYRCYLKPKLVDKHFTILESYGFPKENIHKHFVENNFKLSSLKKEIKKEQKERKKAKKELNKKLSNKLISSNNTKYVIDKKESLFSNLFKKNKEGTKNGFKQRKEKEKPSRSSKTKKEGTDRGTEGRKKINRDKPDNRKITKRRIF